MILPKHSNTKITHKIGKYILNNYPKFSATKLSKILNMDDNTIRKFLKLNNIEIKCHSYFSKGRISKKRSFNTVQESQIVRLYNEGKSQGYLAKKFNTSKIPIKSCLKRNKVKIRSFFSSYFKQTGKSRTHEGYIELVIPKNLRHLFNNNRRAKEHRLIMTKFLNRPLLSTETVDHKNGVRTDNRLKNLELYSTAHGAGQDVQHTIQRSIDDILRLGSEYLTGKHGKDKMNAKYKKQLKQMLGK